MGNKNRALVFAVAASSMVGCVASQTADIEDEAQQSVESTPADKPRGEGLGKLPALDLAHLTELPAHARVFGPAPGISYFQTYAVGSSSAGVWEYIDPSQFSTVLDHGGASLSVAVLQLGYGSGGASLNVAGVHYAQDRLCGSSSLHICNNGEIIVGYLDYYSFDGQQSGTFTAFSDSIASPFGRSTDALNVR
jgi:Domain of unknown function (DUF4879)